jgi:hypothetical protein
MSIFNPIQVQAYDYKTMYKKFAQTLRNKSKDNAYMAIIDTEQPILLISKSVISTDISIDEWYMTVLEAKVYQYSKSKKKIVYVGKVYSGSTSCPISRKGKYLVSYFHHYAERSSYKNAIGTMVSVRDEVMSGTGTKIKSNITIKNGKRRITSKKTISAKMYNQTYKQYVSKSKPIKFSEIQAKSSKAYYYSHCANEQYANGMDLNISHITKAGNKLKIMGSIAKTKSFEEYLKGNYTIEYDQTFTIANNCKYYSSGGSGTTNKISQGKFIKMINTSEWGAWVTVVFETDKNGKIYYMKIDTSM